jgi:alpha-2-macroglobulin
MWSRRTAPSLIFACAALATSCTSDAGRPAATVGSTATPTTTRSRTEVRSDDALGAPSVPVPRRRLFDIALSSGGSIPEAAGEPTQVVAGTPLPQERIDEINSWLPSGDNSVAGPTATGAAADIAKADEPTALAPLTVVGFIPQQVQLDLEQTFVAVFDQRVDPARLQEYVEVSADNGSVPVRLATADEINATRSASEIVGTSQPGRWLAFRPVEAFPRDATVTVSLFPDGDTSDGIATIGGVPQTYTARTYGDLRVGSVSCAQDGEVCGPYQGLSITLSNPLDVAASKANGVTSADIVVSPRLADQRVNLAAQIRIEGTASGRSTYSITLPAGLTDIYGQQLDTSVTKTVTFGDSDVRLDQLEPVTTLDAFITEPKLAITSAGHFRLRVRVFEAPTADVASYFEYAANRDDPEASLPAWRVLRDDVMAVEPSPDSVTETLVDLSNEMIVASSVIVLVEPMPPIAATSVDSGRSRPILTWAQRSSFTIDSFDDASTIRVWASDLRTGAPLQDVTVTASSGQRASTDADGLASLKLIDTQVEWLVAKRGDEVALQRVFAYKGFAQTRVKMFRFTNRVSYRPGERAIVKGWIRAIDPTTNAPRSVPDQRELGYTVTGVGGDPLVQGSLSLGALGGFSLAVDIPDDSAPGEISVEMPQIGEGFFLLVIDPLESSVNVDVRAASTEPLVSAEPASWSLHATDPTGAPLPDSEVTWSVQAQATNFAPPGWDGFTFGIAEPRWSLDGDGSENSDARTSDRCPCDLIAVAPSRVHLGRTDTEGNVSLRLDFSGPDGVLPDLPIAIAVSGAVAGSGEQTGRSGQRAIVHAADRYVGLRSPQQFVHTDDPLVIDAIVTDIGGQSVSDVDIEVSAGLSAQPSSPGSSDAPLVDPQICTIRSAADPQRCTFDTSIPGRYVVRSVVSDADGGRNRTELTIWVIDAEQSPELPASKARLVALPDAAAYAPGAVAQVLVQAPFASGEGLAVVGRSEQQDTIRFTVRNGSAVVPIPIRDSDYPAIAVLFYVAGSDTRTDASGEPLTGSPPETAFATIPIQLRVPPTSRSLQVTATPRTAEVMPGESTAIDVSVTDATGAPVEGADVALMVVGAAAGSPSAGPLPDPLSVFYPYGSGLVRTSLGRRTAQVLDLADPLVERQVDTWNVPTGPFDTDSEFYVNAFDVVDLGSVLGSEDFSWRSQTASSVLLASLTTDARGQASVDLALDGGAPRYRIVAVAAGGVDRFGSGEGSVLVTPEVTMTLPLPRSVTAGQRFDLPVTVRNNSLVTTDLDVVVQITNLDVTADDVLATRITVPAGEQVVVRFNLTSGSPGAARYRVIAASETTVVNSAEGSVQMLG